MDNQHNAKTPFARLPEKIAMYLVYPRSLMVGSFLLSILIMILLLYSLVGNWGASCLLNQYAAVGATWFHVLITIWCLPCQSVTIFLMVICWFLRSSLMCLSHIFFGVARYIVQQKAQSHQRSFYSSQLVFFLQMWPSHRKLHFWICSLTEGCCSQLVWMVQFWWWSRRVTPKICLRNHIWKTSSLFMSGLSKVHVSCLQENWHDQCW